MVHLTMYLCSSQGFWLIRYNGIWEGNSKLEIIITDLLKQLFFIILKNKVWKCEKGQNLKTEKFQVLTAFC